MDVFQGGHLFFPDGGHPLPPEDDDNESEYFSEEYWQVLSPVLTKLYLVIGEDEVYIEGQAWLNSMQKLQHLEIHGCAYEDGYQPVLFGPSNLSLSALKLLRLENFSSLPDWHLDCPSLEALHLRGIKGLCMPTGLGSCSRLTTLNVAAHMDPAHVEVDARLVAAIKAVQATLEILDVSGWAAGVLDSIKTLPRLHTLVAQRNGLTAVPALPATLKSLDLRANEFTEVPVQLESLTQLTSLALSSKKSLANFQIRRPLDALISLPQLRNLTLVLDSDANDHEPAFSRWGARSLYYLGLAQHEIAKSKRSLLLNF